MFLSHKKPRLKINKYARLYKNHQSTEMTQKTKIQGKV